MLPLMIEMVAEYAICTHKSSRSQTHTHRWGVQLSQPSTPSGVGQAFEQAVSATQTAYLQ